MTVYSCVTLIQMAKVFIVNAMDKKTLLTLQEYTSLEVTVKQLKDDIYDAKGWHVRVVQIDQTSTFEDSDMLQDILDREKEQEQNDLANKRAQRSDLIKKRDTLPLYGPSSTVRQRFEIEEKIQILNLAIQTCERRPQTGDSVTVKVLIPLKVPPTFKQFST